jgi:hypothetical protein
MDLSTLKSKIPFGLVLSFIAGLVIGLVVLGWWLWPVQYTDTDPASLRARHQITYVEMVSDSYAVNADLAKAQARLRELEGGKTKTEDVAALVAKIAADKRAAGQVDEAARVQKLATAIGAKPAVAAPTVSGKEPTKAATKPAAGTTPAAAPTKAAATATKSRTSACLLPIFLALIALGIILILFYLRTRKTTRTAPVSARMPRRAAPKREAPVIEEGGAQAEPAPIAWDTEGDDQPALGHFVTTFELGDDGYDESFGVETETSEFLGECGVAISELVGTGAPEKPAGFDIWLFDKSDIRTVTKVVVAAGANQDEALRAKLGAKGETVVAQKGEVIELETAALRVRARIVDLTYGSPEQDFFSKLTVELTPSRKA